MAFTLGLTFCILPLAVALIRRIAARRQPVYTVADWQRTSERICQGIRELSYAHCPSSGRYATLHRKTYNALLQDLLANTAFILNLANDACLHLHETEISLACDVLSQSAGLLLRLQYSRLRLLCWPPDATAPHRHTFAVAESYFCLCRALTGLLAHCVARKV